MKLPSLGFQIARAIGMTQPYVSKRHRIMSDVEPSVTSMWRGSVCLLAVDAMRVIVEVLGFCHNS